MPKPVNVDKLGGKIYNVKVFNKSYGICPQKRTQRAPGIVVAKTDPVVFSLKSVPACIRRGKRI
jgi:hypothetical protein